MSATGKLFNQLEKTWHNKLEQTESLVNVFWNVDPIRILKFDQYQYVDFAKPRLKQYSLLVNMH